MRILCLIFVIFVSPAFAAGNTSSTAVRSNLDTSHGFEMEGIITLHSILETSVSLAGVSLGKEFFEDTLFGFRTMLPLKNSEGIDFFLCKRLVVIIS